MRLQLKENPKEWRKLAWLSCGFMFLLASLFYWRGVISGRTLQALTVLFGGISCVAWRKPELFRSFYRAVMSVSFRVGQVMGKCLLGLVYVLMVTPLGLVLRLSGRDLLQIRSAKQKSYWRTPRRIGNFDQQF